mmetsp:Transcript_97724/g.273484  ORF Transcript_97724/g.273484 Transcript_97724/m.273484 type:complete len:203 (+) Transcript_97724:157-765(+)
MAPWSRALAASREEISPHWSPSPAAATPWARGRRAAAAAPRGPEAGKDGKGARARGRRPRCRRRSIRRMGLGRRSPARSRRPKCRRRGPGPRRCPRAPRWTPRSGPSPSKPGRSRSSPRPRRRDRHSTGTPRPHRARWRGPLRSNPARPNRSPRGTRSAPGRRFRQGCGCAGPAVRTPAWAGSSPGAQHPLPVSRSGAKSCR